MEVVEPFSEVSWERMIRAVEKVRERLRRATATLEAAGVAYAVCGGNAVAAWVSTIDDAAVRNTRDVDILIRREDLPAVIEAMQSAGFVHRHAAGIDMFLDGPHAKARDAVHILFAGERIREEDPQPAADVSQSEASDYLCEPSRQMQVVTLEALVGTKLTSYRDKDRTHLRDMIDVQLIDETWPARFRPELAQRLQELLDNPDG